MIVGATENDHMRRNPPHPGRLLRSIIERDPDFPEDQPGMTIGEAAAKIGASRVNLSRVLNERGRVTIDLALKLEAVGWGAANSWVRFQANFDLAQARKRRRQPYSAAPVHRQVEQLRAKPKAA